LIKIGLIASVLYNAISFVVFIIFQMGRVLKKRIRSVQPKRSIRKRTLNLWDTDRMAHDMNEFAERKLSLRQISRSWGIPKSTLQRRVCGKVQHCEHASGRHPALPKNTETELCDYLKELARRGFPLRPMEVRALVYQFAMKYGYSGIGSTKTKTAGRFWFRRFMKHHPELSLLKPEGLSVARAMGCNKEVVTKWFEKYRETLDKLGMPATPHIYGIVMRRGYKTSFSQTQLWLRRAQHRIKLHLEMYILSHFSSFLDSKELKLNCLARN